MLSLLIPGLFASTYAIIAWKRLDWAVMLLLAALPAYQVRFEVLGIPLTLLEVMILTAFVVWVVKTRTCLACNFLNRLKGRPGLVPYPFDIEIALLLVIAFVSAGVAGFSNEALGIFKAYFFEPVLVFLLVLNVFKIKLDDADETRNNFGKIIWPLAVSALVVSATAVIERFTGWFSVAEFWPRVTGPYPYPNALGLFLGPLAVLIGLWCVYLLMTVKRRVTSYKLWVIGLIVALALLAIYFARSEGAMVGIAAAVLVCGVLVGGKARLVTLVVGVAVLTGILAYAPARGLAIEKITLRDLSGEIRKQQWRETWAMMTESPSRFIFGAGLSGYQTAVAPYHQEGIFYNFDKEPWEDFHRKTVFNEEYKRTHWQPVEVYMYPHNILLNFWTELGLAGALLFIWIIGKFFYMAYGLVRSRVIGYWLLVIGVLGSMAVVVVHGLVDVPYFKNDLAVLFWVLLALVSIVKLNVYRKDYR